MAHLLVLLAVQFALLLFNVAGTEAVDAALGRLVQRELALVVGLLLHGLVGAGHVERDLGIGERLALPQDDAALLINGLQDRQNLQR